MNLEFNKALRRIVSEELRGNNPVPDILGFLHLKHLRNPDLHSKLKTLLAEYKSRTYMPRSLLKIDVPKANFTIRPMARPVTEDWLIYEAIIDYLSKRVLKNKGICAMSFSILHFRTDNKKRTEPWLKFNETSRDFYKRGYDFSVITDITGYYENINLEELRCRIIDYLGKNKEEAKLTDVLFNLLRKWGDERISGYGLPQGPLASSFLADIFLDYVDRNMEKHKGYFRYMDDIRIFCKRELDAKIALKDLTIALRGLKLNINAKKTDILHGKQIEEKLFDPKKPILSFIEMTLKSHDKELIENSAIPGLMQLVEDAFFSDPFENTHLNFALYRLFKLHNSGSNFGKEKIVKYIQNNLVSKPHHTGLFCNFLSMFPNDRKIVKFLVSFLKSKSNIYEWQELKVLQSLLRFNFTASRPEISLFLDLAQNSNKHYAVRAFYFLLVGKYGNNRDRNIIIDTYDSLPGIYTKMAAILSVQELGPASRNAFYARVKASKHDEGIGQFADYVKSLSNPIYFLTTEKPTIEIYEGEEEPFYPVI